MFGKKKARVEGTVERFNVHSWDSDSTGYVVLLEGHNTPYFISHGWRSRGAPPYPISLTERGDKVSFTVGSERKVLVDDFINETLERRLVARADRLT